MDLQAYIEEVRVKHHLPALAVAVYRKGKADEIAVCGVRKAGDNTLVTVDDKFHMGSCGKAVTAAIIHKLIGEGKLRINETLEEILPDDMPIHEQYRYVTIGDLLTHCSGLPANEGTLTQAPAHMRGEYAYSNIGYILLGQIAEYMTNTSFQELAQQRIFTPLHMDSAGFGPAASNSRIPDAPWGHKHDESHILEPINRDNPPLYAAAGTMHASVGDWLKFLQFELEQQRITQPYAITNSGYTDSALVKEGEVYFHNGSNLFNYSLQTLMPKQNAAFVVASNDGSDEAYAAINEVSSYLTKQIAQEIGQSSSDRPIMKSALQRL